ncbi:hypothetical protein EUGRSUZ_D01896 [Eucalyptus grandis]|uniref:Uncharacterized protein n=2 Tax=Eucalyptus grandis TaxID=71139 RepID=A0ACC3L6F2_EUCGR|nr:hypothetical protein EUGRSUZ_D01896 [Eucalyptus grandis]
MNVEHMQVDYTMGDNPRATSYVVSGPNAYDNFADQRDNYKQMEPATHNNAPFPGILVRLSGGHGGYVTASNELSTEQKPTVSWTANGRTYHRYLTVVTDKLDKTLKYVNLLISKLYGPLWAVTKSGDLYVFPSWIQSLPSGKSLEFVYIHASPQADISISSYTMA